MSRPLSFRASADSARKLDKLTKATQRPRSWLLQQALDSYLQDQSWQIQHIKQGLDELRAGAGMPHEQVAEWLTSWGDDDEVPRPE